VSEHDPHEGPLVLVVCTGNIARSPFAAVLLAHEAARRLAPGRVRSAGVHGLHGHGAVVEMVDAARSRGLDLVPHRGARVTVDDLRASGIVIAMEEAQRDAMVRLAPDARERVFTLKELARLTAGMGPVDVPDEPHARIEAIARAAHEARPLVRRPHTPEDVEDPYGGTAEEYDACVAEIETLVAAVAEPLFGSARDE